MSVMVVTGAFATHTTKLYNYYICPANWNADNIEHIVVNYNGVIQYIGRIIRNVENFNYYEETKIFEFQTNDLPRDVVNDLYQFKTLLHGGMHRLFILAPILGGFSGCEKLKHQGSGAFTQSHRYFETLTEMFACHQNVDIEILISEDVSGVSSTINNLEI